MKASHKLGLAPVIVLIGAGCQSPDGRHPTGSQSITTSQSYSALFVANTTEGSVSKVDVSSGLVGQIDVGQEPTRIARARDRLFVTLRAERAVAVVRDGASSMQVEGRISVGAEPYGVVSTHDGSKVYVASSLEGTVSEIDAGSFTVLRKWNVDDQPRWLALHPNGRTLYVASAFNGTLSMIDLSGNGSTTPTALKLRSLPINGHASSQRITGDPAVAPDGSRMIIPAMYVDNTTPIDDPAQAGLMAQERPSGGYESAGETTTKRLNPSMVVADINDDGKPNLDQAKVVQAIALPATGYVANVAISPDSQLALVSIEGASAVGVMEIDPENVRHPINNSNIFATAFSDGKDDPNKFQTRRAVAVKVGAGPRSAVFLADDRAMAYSFLDRQIADIDVGDANDHLASPGSKGNDTDAMSPGLIGGQVQQFPLAAKKQIEVAESVLAPDVDHGRRLFYATDDTQMSGSGSGISCATCHFEGRNDGWTWVFDRGPRQTPSLAGKVSLTAPVRWEGDRPTVADDAFQTSQNLMGGKDLSQSDAADIQAFIDAGRDVDVPLKGSTDESVLRGKKIFESAQVGCSACHNGARLTNNSIVSLLGLDQVKVRSLVGVYASPPYFHDGSAATLRDVLDRVRDGSMGDTSSLDDQQLADLTAYVSSL
jgi:DNA-binding beta-propeller fold protein YncE